MQKILTIAIKVQMRFFFFYRNMAGVEKEQRRNTQVEETINKLYNEIKDKNIPRKIVNSIGDYLDKERQISSGFSWTDVKGGSMIKTTLISKFKHYSRKTYTSREIFLNLLEKWNPTSRFEMV